MIESGTIRYLVYGFLLVFYRNFVPCWDVWLQKCRDLKNRVRGPSRSLEMSPFDRVHTTSYWRSIVTLKLVSFLRYSMSKMSWPWNPGQRSLKIIGTDTYRYATYDFLLTFHSNHRPISYRFRDRRRFQSKTAKFSHRRVFYAPTDRATLGLGIGARGHKATRWSKKFQDRFSRLDTIPACDGRTDKTDRHVAVAKTALCYASRE